MNNSFINVSILLQKNTSNYKNTKIIKLKLNSTTQLKPEVFKTRAKLIIIKNYQTHEKTSLN